VNDNLRRKRIFLDSENFDILNVLYASQASKQASQLHETK